MFEDSGAHDDVCPLEDARYDAIVLWCETRDPASTQGSDSILAFDLAITAGAHRGDTLTVLAPRAVLGDRGDLDVVGVPCVLTVRDGRPLIEW
jgi:hypothetical protein